MLKKNCLFCNTEFETRYPFRKFCSDYCKNVSYYNNNKPKQDNNKVCLTCNKPFYNRNDYINYCSLECSQDDKNKNYYIKIKNLKRQKGSKKTYKLICECCGKEFESYQKLKRFCSDDCINKTKREKLLLEDGTYFVQSKEFIDKANKTKKEKYGNGNWYVEKIKKTCREKYGTEWSQQAPEIRAKVSATKRKYFKQLKEEYINNFIKSKRYDDNGYCNYYEYAYDNNKELINTDLNISKDTIQDNLYNWIKSFYNGEIIKNYKNFLDIYIPDKRIAVEYHTLMVDSFGKSSHKSFYNYVYEPKRRNDLLNKTIICERKQIRLFHIYENEFIYYDKRDIWESVIKNSLDLTENKIDARDCKIKELNESDVADFLITNHLQGYKKSKVILGLYYNNELVQVSAFSKSRFNKNYDWELIRHCSKINYSIRGGFTKLLSYFKSNYQGSILSYGNRRWTYLHKNVYGERLISITEPNFFIFDIKERPVALKSRNQFLKYKLKDKLKIYEDRISASINLYNNGFRKIYDCGSLVYEL